MAFCVFFFLFFLYCVSFPVEAFPVREMYHESTELFLFHISSRLDYPCAVGVRAIISIQLYSKYDMNLHNSCIRMSFYAKPTMLPLHLVDASFPVFFLHTLAIVDKQSFSSPKYLH